MDLATYERVREELVTTATPSGGLDLDSMLMDFHAYLGGLEDLEDIRVRRTGDPRQLIEVRAHSRATPTISPHAWNGFGWSTCATPTSRHTHW